jgi:hypothetical protein
MTFPVIYLFMASLASSRQGISLGNTLVTADTGVQGASAKFPPEILGS